RFAAVVAPCRLFRGVLWHGAIVAATAPAAGSPAERMTGKGLSRPQSARAGQRSPGGGQPARQRLPRVGPRPWPALPGALSGRLAAASCALSAAGQGAAGLSAASLGAADSAADRARGGRAKR